jgi:hypothetical protein
VNKNKIRKQEISDENINFIPFLNTSKKALIQMSNAVILNQLALSRVKNEILFIRRIHKKARLATETEYPRVILEKQSRRHSLKLQI